MQHVLILDEDTDAVLRLRRSLRGAGVCLEQAGTLLAAYRRIACLPTLNVLIVNVAHRECGAVEDFARQVIPAITLMPVGPYEGPATPGGQCVPWSTVMATLALAACPGAGPGEPAEGGWPG